MSSRKWDGKERRKPDPVHLQATKQAAKEGVYEALTDITDIDISTPEGRKHVRELTPN